MMLPVWLRDDFLDFIFKESVSLGLLLVLLEFCIFFIKWLIAKVQLILSNKRMVDKIKDAANYFKSVLNKDEIKQLLNSVINDEEFQPPTSTLHQIANASYSKDDWTKIWAFILDKLKSNKGVRINKALAVVEFLLKHGSPTITSDLKDEIRLFRDLEEFKGKGETELRINSIHRKANTIVDLLGSQRKLNEQRVEAEAIRAKLGGNNYSNKTYNNNAKAIQNNKVTYEGMGSTNYSQDVGKPSGSSFVKSLSKPETNNNQGYIKPGSLKIEHSSNSNVEKSKATGKLFQGLTVKKPMGITKVHNEHHPRETKSEIKQQQQQLPSKAQSNDFDIFSLGVEQKIQKDNSGGLDLFEISSYGNQSQSQSSVSSSSNQMDIFGLSSQKSGNQTPQFNSNVTLEKSDIFSFGNPNSNPNSNIYTFNNLTSSKPTGQEKAFDIFQNQLSQPLEIKTEFRMNPIVSQTNASSEPKSKYDMFQEFNF